MVISEIGAVLPIVEKLRALGCTKIELWDNGELHTLEFASTVVQVPGPPEERELDEETKEAIAKEFLQNRLNREESELLASS